MSIYQLYMQNQTDILSLKRVTEYFVCNRNYEPPCIWERRIAWFLSELGVERKLSEELHCI